MKLRSKLLKDSISTFSEIQDVLEDLNLWEDFLKYHDLYTEDEKNNLSDIESCDLMEEVSYRGILPTIDNLWENPSITQTIWLQEQLEKAKDII